MRGVPMSTIDKIKIKGEYLNGAYSELAAVLGIDAVLKIHSKYRGTQIFFPVELFNGDFDQCVSSSVLRVRKNYRDDNSALVLVLPYPTAEYLNNENYFHDYYTDIEISHAASMAHPKSAIQIRNREMVDRADLIICYIEHEKGGAWQTVEYAIKQGKTVINLANENESVNLL